MRLIKSSYEIWQQPSGLEGVYKQIERVGRVCYRSEDKITEDSAKPFVDRMIKSGHGAMLEHGTVYLYYKVDKPSTMVKEIIDFYKNNQYSKVKCIKKYSNTYSECGMGRLYDIKYSEYFITTNLRVCLENNRQEYLTNALCEPTEYHEKRICVRFICDRGISHEFVRHKVFSFAQESTRYCNYSKDKFGNEVIFIEPCWLEDYNYEGNTYYNGFLVALRAAEANYLGLMKEWEDKIPDKRYKTGFRNNPWTPQQARAVLPNALKTELVMTGFVSDWKHFFRLRSRIAETGKPHPQAQELADPLMDEFVKRGIMETLL